MILVYRIIFLWSRNDTRVYTCRRVCFPAVTKEKRIVFSPNSAMQNNSESSLLRMCRIAVRCVGRSEHIQTTRWWTRTGSASGTNGKWNLIFHYLVSNSKHLVLVHGSLPCWGSSYRIAYYVPWDMTGKQIYTTFVVLLDSLCRVVVRVPGC
jgi:hypothetical protein